MLTDSRGLPVRTSTSASASICRVTRMATCGSKVQRAWSLVEGS